MSVDLSLYNNKWYRKEIGASRFKQITWYLVNIIFIKNRFFTSSGLKVALLRLFGAGIGAGVVIKPAVNIKYPWKLKIGDHSWIGESVWIDNLAMVTIGNSVCLSQGAYLLTGNHNYKLKTFDLMVEPITIEDGVWIGAKAIVCPGITCKKYSVLTAGSVAVTNLEHQKIYQGNPAQPIRDRSFES